MDALGEFVDEKARAVGASGILAHSVASIIATLAAQRQGSPVTTIISLEGNLAPEDAYFSGTAAQYQNPEDFRAAFLARLGEMAKGQPEVARYKAQVETADPQALWELGCDANAYSESNVPGDALNKAAQAVYIYNPENISPSARQWLQKNAFNRHAWRLSLAEHC